MSIASEITRIAGLRDKIRTKLKSLGIITDASATLDTCTTAINNIASSALTVPTIKISSPTISVNTTTGAITVSGSGSGTATTSKGYTNSAISKTVSASVSGSKTITVYTGTVS